MLFHRICYGTDSAWCIHQFSDGMAHNACLQAVEREVRLSQKSDAEKEHDELAESVKSSSDGELSPHCYALSSTRHACITVFM